MVKIGATIGGLLGLFLSTIYLLFSLSMPTGLEEIPEFEPERSPQETTEIWINWFFISMVLITFGGVIGGVIEGVIRGFMPS